MTDGANEQSISPRLALEVILARSNGECASNTNGIGACIRHGRSILARYGADMVCESCVAALALGVIDGFGSPLARPPS